MKKIAVLLLAVFVLLFVVACGASPESGTSSENDSPQIKVMEPWSRPSPMTAGNGAVYMMLMNEGGNTDTLVSVETDVAEVVELHETKMENDVMKMSPIEGGIEVPGGGSAELKPGGMHVMLINLKEELVPGKKISLTLNFAKSTPMKIEAEIREMGGDMGQDMKDMDHDNMDMEEKDE